MAGDKADAIATLIEEAGGKVLSLFKCCVAHLMLVMVIGNHISTRGGLQGPLSPQIFLQSKIYFKGICYKLCDD